jgi:hypothetical protein
MATANESRSLARPTLGQPRKKANLERRSVIMSRIPTAAVESAAGATAEVFAQIKKAAGKVPNTFAAIGAHDTAALKVMLQADAVLAAGTLSKQDQSAQPSAAITARPRTACSPSLAV